MGIFGWPWTKRPANLSVRVRLCGSRPIANQRVELCGQGEIAFGENVQIGWAQSPAFASTYGYFEARFPHSLIRIGDGCIFSNDAAVVSESDGGGYRHWKRMCVRNRLSVL